MVKIWLRKLGIRDEAKMIEPRELIDPVIYIEARRKLDKHFESFHSDYIEIPDRTPIAINAAYISTTLRSSTVWFKNNPSIVPCPFCGCATCFAVVRNPRDAEGLLMYEQCFVGCFVCKISTEKLDNDELNKDKLIKMWNQRVE